jgi:hypothetical protein
MWEYAICVEAIEKSRELGTDVREKNDSREDCRFNCRWE